ncbi:hypothetical protein MKZ38_000219 [Zalerion maritima]|uniref:Uncharacterized protein n=1 Tax=Zalerion maritima TaxID=339359 RepID=A0AAD5RTE7_9PEZI|nr:hypothetical protein MKZ38_000219 [Zalerion maritima]
MSTSTMNKYWIPALYIHKKVITQEIQYHLGPQATVRAFTRDGEDGFLITTLGPCLSDEQIDDICIKSLAFWEKQAAQRSSTNPDRHLKRPLHQPVTIARGQGSSSIGKANGPRRNDYRKRSEDGRKDIGMRREQVDQKDSGNQEVT